MIETLFDSYGTDTEPMVDTRTTEQIADDEAAYRDFSRAFASGLPERPGTIRR